MFNRAKLEEYWENKRKAMNKSAKKIRAMNDSVYSKWKKVDKNKSALLFLDDSKNGSVILGNNAIIDLYHNGEFIIDGYYGYRMDDLFNEIGKTESLDEIWDDDIRPEERPVADDAAAVLVRYIEQEYGREGVLSLLLAAAYATDPGSLFAIGLSADAALVEQGFLEYLAGQITPEAARQIGVV